MQGRHPVAGPPRTAGCRCGNARRRPRSPAHDRPRSRRDPLLGSPPAGGPPTRVSGGRARSSSRSPTRRSRLHAPEAGDGRPGHRRRRLSIARGEPDVREAANPQRGARRSNPGTRARPADIPAERGSVAIPSAEADANAPPRRQRDSVDDADRRVAASERRGPNRRHGVRSRRPPRPRGAADRSRRWPGHRLEPLPAACGRFRAARTSPGGAGGSPGDGGQPRSEHG